MAIDFDTLPQPRRRYAPPPTADVAIMMFVAGAGGALMCVLFLWLPEAHADGLRFWVAVVVVPIAAGLFLASLLMYLANLSALQVAFYNELVRNTNKSVIDFARLPLHALAASFRIGADPQDNDVERLGSGQLMLESVRDPAQPAELIRARWFRHKQWPIFADDVIRGEYVVAWLLHQLLSDIQPRLTSLRLSRPLQLVLCVSCPLSQERCGQLLQVAWGEVGLEKIPFEPVWANDLDLMWLDAWMDDAIGRVAKDPRLILALDVQQVITMGPRNAHTEAGVALLMAPAPVLARHFGIEPLAFVHRPVAEGRGDDASVVALALNLTQARTSEPESAWVTDLSGRTLDVLAKHTPSARISPLDARSGYAGCAAPWLATACAVSAAAEQALGQWVACSAKDQLQLLVVRPNNAT